jgi:outer membrane scaffolding protein for murein synthesis (MipA/OmpV family)
MAVVLIAPRATAQPLPSWELGIGVGVIGFGDYRGSDVTHVYPVPVPYAVYRGKILKSDENGVRGDFLNQTYIDLSASINATTPVNSSSEARRGMPYLKSTLEIGPSINLHLWSSDDRRVRWSLRTVARDAITVESSPHSIGWFASPTLDLDIAAPFRRAGWNLGLSAGPLFADQRYHNYFYGVAPQYATAERPTYRPPGGYSGTQLVASLSKRYPRFWVGAFVRHDWLNGVAFDGSPLFLRKDYWRGGIGIAWIIGQSTRLVDTGPEPPEPAIEQR